MKVPTPLLLDTHALGLEQHIKALPSAPGIYVLRMPGKPPHISWSANLSRRLLRLLVSSYTAPSRMLSQVRDVVHSVECWPVGSKLEAALLIYQVTKTHFAEDYLVRLRLRMPWFVALTSNDPFARLHVLNRIPRKSNALFGPFRTRDFAQQYLDEVQSLFQIRRCPESFSPSPDHPGCIYGEMYQCLRPCQCAVTTEEYASESQRVSDFLSTNGKSAISVLSSARDRAAAETDFEQAALLHKRIEKMNLAAASRDEVIGDVFSFNGVALTRTVNPHQLCLWPMHEGHWQEPLSINLSPEDSQPRSLDRDLRERLATASAQPLTQGNRLEQLALFARWYYSSWRDGSWFPFRTLADLNYRRLVREISNLSKPART